MSATANAPGLPVEVSGLTKRFGLVHAVEDLTFTVEPGRVTGFLGPNGSGKTTTLRMLLGLVQPTAGTATIGGRAYTSIERPSSVVGAVLEASFHPGRSGRGHLRVLAPLVGVPDSRVDEVLELVGLAGDADRPAGGYSLGMKQRLGLAATLLGDPPVLILDEPTNGLDPHGIVWLRDLLRHLAREGRTVLVSSHMLGEVQATVDDVVVISRGRLVHASPLEDLVAMATSHVVVAGPDQSGLGRALLAAGFAVTPTGAHLQVEGATAAQVGAVAHAGGYELHELGNAGASLEQTFLKLVEDRAGGGAPGEPGTSGDLDESGQEVAR